MAGVILGRDLLQWQQGASSEGTGAFSGGVDPDLPPRQLTWHTFAQSYNTAPRTKVWCCCFGQSSLCLEHVYKQWYSKSWGCLVSSHTMWVNLKRACKQAENNVFCSVGLSPMSVVLLFFMGLWQKQQLLLFAWNSKFRLDSGILFFLAWPFCRWIVHTSAGSSKTVFLLVPKSTQNFGALPYIPHDFTALTNTRCSVEDVRLTLKV